MTPDHAHAAMSHRRYRERHERDAVHKPLANRCWRPGRSSRRPAAKKIATHFMPASDGGDARIRPFDMIEHGAIGNAAGDPQLVYAAHVAAVRH